MTIVTVDPKADQSLPEYHVGKASSTCIYPGIAQCFAIAGWTANSMLCTHVSPGATKDDMDETFASLHDMGGDQALFWYVAGPFTEHFAVTRAQWRSVKAIKKTFKNAFNNKAAAHWILDATEERNTTRIYPGTTIPSRFSSIDVRAERRAWESMIVFSYKEHSRSVTEWTRFRTAKFKRF
jgi:hypothetical protein